MSPSHLVTVARAACALEPGDQHIYLGYTSNDLGGNWAAAGAIYRTVSICTELELTDDILSGTLNTILLSASY